jgi:hypothetical protein
MKRIALWLAAAALLAICASGAMAAPASAEATIIQQTIAQPIFDTGLTDDCRAGVTGTITGTDVVTFQTVEDSVGFHTTGTTVDTARIDWSDGSYSIVESIDHFSFGTVGGEFGVKTVAHQDSGTTYSADGVFLSRATGHVVEHFTATDGVYRVKFERAQFRSFGSC